MFRISSQRAVIRVCACLILAASHAAACPIPVFRHALEFWPTERYEIVVLHRGPLAPADETVVSTLQRADSHEVTSANLRVRTIDLAADPDEPLTQPLETQPAQELPWMIVRYPGAAQPRRPIWSGRLRMAAARALIDSPVRREIARRTLRGETAVWILLESGDREKDDAAAGLLLATHKKMQEAPQLPLLEGDIGLEELGWDADPEPETSFSLVRLTRSDAAEQMLIKMLRHAAGEHEDPTGPMMFPVFGRGRVLCTLAAGDINEKNIETVYEFLTGPCSCYALQCNPGMALLMSANWDNLLADGVVIDEVLPPPVGGSRVVSLPAAFGSESAAGSPVATGEAALAAQAARSVPGNLSEVLVRRTLIVFVLAVVSVAVAALLLKLRKL